jgi:hypothetical protein
MPIGLRDVLEGVAFGTYHCVSKFGILTRCPKGMKKTLFDHCAHFMFAFYGDYLRWDGLVERIIYYEDDKYADLIECHDFFQRRKDMLKKRIYFIKEMKVLKKNSDVKTSKN